MVVSLVSEIMCIVQSKEKVERQKLIICVRVLTISDMSMGNKSVQFTLTHSALRTSTLHKWMLSCCTWASRVAFTSHKVYSIAYEFTWLVIHLLCSTLCWCIKLVDKVDTMVQLSQLLVHAVPNNASPCLPGNPTADTLLMQHQLNSVDWPKYAFV